MQAHAQRLALDQQAIVGRGKRVERAARDDESFRRFGPVDGAFFQADLAAVAAGNRHCGQPEAPAQRIDIAPADDRQPPVQHVAQPFQQRMQPFRHLHRLLQLPCTPQQAKGPQQDGPCDEERSEVGSGSESCPYLEHEDGPLRPSLC